MVIIQMHQYNEEKDKSVYFAQKDVSGFDERAVFYKETSSKIPLEKGNKWVMYTEDSENFVDQEGGED